MAETTIQRIIEVHTSSSVDSVKSLKQEINDLKDALLNVEKGSADYDKGVKLLQEDQRRLNEVTALTKKENVAVAGSYYDLNNQLVQARKAYKDLNEEQRNNAEVGGALLTKIKNLDTTLKDLDAGMGQYQRNVGNYESAFNGLGDALSKLPEGAGATVDGFKKMGTAMKLVSTNPLMGMIGILAPVIRMIADSIKDNGNALDVVKNAMKALEPVTDAMSKVVEKLAGWIGEAVSWFAKLFQGSGETFQKIIGGVTGAGNAILQYLLAPIRTTIEAFKGLGKIIGDVFKGNWSDIKKDAADAFSGIKDAWTTALSFKDNFSTGKEVGANFAAGLKASKPQVKEEAAAIAQEASDELKKVWMSETEFRKYILQQQLALVEKGSADELAIRQQQRELEWEIERARLEDSIQNELEREEAIKLAEQVFQADMLALKGEYADAVEEANGNVATIDEKARKEEYDAWVKLQKAKVATLQNSFSTITSLMEAFGGESAKQSQAYKAVASAQALVQAMLSANEAYASMASIPLVGPAMGAAAAAAALATGLANVKAINATSMDSVASTASVDTAAPVAVSAPAVIQQVATTRTLTSASEEERLNQSTRVYVVYDDISQAGKQVQVQHNESTF